MSFNAVSVKEIAAFHAPKPMPTNRRTPKIGKYSRLNAIGCLYARNVIPVTNATMRPEITADSNSQTPNVMSIEKIRCMLARYDAHPTPSTT